MVASLTTRLNVSKKSIPRVWKKPLTTKCTLYHLTVPLGLYLTQNTHLLLTICIPKVQETSIQVLFLTKAQT